MKKYTFRGQKGKNNPQNQYGRVTYSFILIEKKWILLVHVTYIIFLTSKNVSVIISQLCCLLDTWVMDFIYCIIYWIYVW
jgi:hypothetical protein